MINLTPEQAKHVETIKWLISGPRCTGRTFLIACVSVDNAAQHVGEWQHLFTHEGHSAGSPRIYMYEQCQKAFDEGPYDKERFRLECSANAFKIRVAAIDASSPFITGTGSAETPRGVMQAVPNPNCKHMSVHCVELAGYPSIKYRCEEANCGEYLDARYRTVIPFIRKE